MSTSQSGNIDIYFLIIGTINYGNSSNMGEWCIRKEIMIIQKGALDSPCIYKLNVILIETGPNRATSVCMHARYKIVDHCMDMPKKLNV